MITSALLALFTTSCFEQSAVIRLNKDGSGTITETTLLSAEASAMLEGAAAQGGGEDPLSKMTDKDLTAAYAKKLGEGVEVEKAGKVEKGGKKGVEVVYKFKDINKVSFVMGGSMVEASKAMAPPGAEVKTPDQKPVTFKYADKALTIANPANKPAAKPEGAEKPEIDPAQMEMAKGMFKDMRMTFKVEIVDGIAETNASHVEGNVVTLIDMPFGKLLADPANMKKLEAMKDASPADAAAAFKDIAGLKIETKEEVTVKVK